MLHHKFTFHVSTLIWIVHIFLQMLLCVAVSITTIHCCQVMQTLTSPNFIMFRIDCPVLWQSYLDLLAVFHTAAFSSLVTSKIYDCVQNLFADQQNSSWKNPVYVHSMLAPSLPSRLLISNKRITLLVPSVKTNTGARTFHSCVPSLWNNLILSVHTDTSVATYRKRFRTHLFDLAFPPWTPARMMAHWCYRTASSILQLNTDSAVMPLTLATPGYWLYRNMIDIVKSCYDISCANASHDIVCTVVCYEIVICNMLCDIILYYIRSYVGYLIVWLISSHYIMRHYVCDIVICARYPDIVGYVTSCDIEWITVPSDMHNIMW